MSAIPSSEHSHADKLRIDPKHESAASIKARLLADITANPGTSAVTRGQETKSAAPSSTDFVDAGFAGEQIYAARNDGYAAAGRDAKVREYEIERARIGDNFARQGYEAIVNYERPVVEVVGDLVTQGLGAQADALLAALTGDPSHYVEAGQLQEALAMRQLEESLAAEEAVENLEYAVEAATAEREAREREAEDARFLERNPNANVDLLRVGQERAWETQGLDLSLAETADRARVAVVGTENHRMKQAILDEGYKSSQAMQRLYPADPPESDPAVAFRTAARVVSLGEGERLKAAALRPELGDAQREFDAARGSAMQRAHDAQKARVDAKRR